MSSARVMHWLVFAGGQPIQDVVLSGEAQMHHGSLQDYSHLVATEPRHSPDEFILPNAGHWRCWLPILRDFHIGWLNEYVPDHRYIHSEFNASTARGRLAIRNSQIVHKMSQGGYPISVACCPSVLLNHGADACWWQNGMSVQKCCGAPILPMRCFHASSDAFVLRADSHGKPVAGVWQQGVANQKDCASLDEFALYFALNEIGGSDKSSSANDFMRFYEPFLHRFGDSASLLEIGVRFGSSLATWSLWFPRGQILGVDIDHQAGLRTQLIARGANTTGNVRVRILDVTSQELIRLTDYKPFDIIVDDGPHYFESQKHVFETLFPASLAPGGVYIVEDFAPDTFVYFQGIATAILRDEANGKKLQFLSKYSFDNLIKSDWRRSVKGVFFGSFSIVVTKWAMFNADAVWS